MDTIIEVYRVLRALSIDVVLGAVVLSNFVSMVVGVNVPWMVFIELALAVWVIYTWDHLSDARKIARPSAYRHQFHKRYDGELRIAMLVAISVGGVVVWKLPVQTVYYGAMASCFVLVYFLLIQFWEKFYYKELMSAIMYSVGVFIGPVSKMPTYATIDIFILFVEVVLIAMINLVIFSEIEKQNDIDDGQLSVAILLKRKSIVFIKWLCLAELTLMVCASVLLNSELFFISQLVLSSMLLVLSLIIFNRDYFKVNDRYRAIGDAIFFIPLIAIL